MYPHDVRANHHGDSRGSDQWNGGGRRTEFSRGDHFAALEVPALFDDYVRAFFSRPDAAR